MNDPDRQQRLWSIPGDGVLAREGDLVLLSGISDRGLVEALLDLLVRASRARGDGHALADMVAAELEKHPSWGGHAAGAEPAVLAFGPAGTELVLIVSGTAWAEVTTTHGTYRLAAGLPSMLLRSVIGIPVQSVRGGLGDEGPADRTDRFTRLDSGTVRAAGLSYYSGQPAQRAAASRAPRPPGRVPPAVPPPAARMAERRSAGPLPEEPLADEGFDPAPAAPADYGPEPADYAPEPADYGPEPADHRAGRAAPANRRGPAAPADYRAGPPEPADYRAGPPEPADHRPGPAAPADYGEYGPEPEEPAFPGPGTPEPEYHRPGSEGPPHYGPAPGLDDLTPPMEDLAQGLAELAPGLEDLDSGGPATMAPTISGPPPEPAPAPARYADADTIDDPSGAPMVLGIYCRNGHFGDPDTRACPVCGAARGRRSGTPEPGPRPVLGLLVLDDGAAVELDGDYVIGRDPTRDPAVSAGDARPLRVVDAESTVSRVHARVHLDGWTVLLTDLGSANGTHIQLPGTKSKQPLEPQVPVPIQHGTAVFVGAQGLRYEPLSRRVPGP